MVAGFDIRQEPIEVEGGIIDCVESFQYLGSLIMDDGKIDEEISINALLMHQELLVLLVYKLYLRMKICQLHNHQEESLSGLCTICPTLHSAGHH